VKSDGCGRLIAHYSSVARFPQEHAKLVYANPHPTVNTRSEIAESQPELLARHCTEAGLTEKAAGLWGKAGQRSLLVDGLE
jgi:hypothetical protein